MLTLILSFLISSSQSFGFSNCNSLFMNLAKGAINWNYSASDTIQWKDELRFKQEIHVGAFLSEGRGFHFGVYYVHDRNFITVPFRQKTASFATHFARHVLDLKPDEWELFDANDEAGTQELFEQFAEASRRHYGRDQGNAHELSMLHFKAFLQRHNQPKKVSAVYVTKATVTDTVAVFILFSDTVNRSRKVTRAVLFTLDPRVDLEPK